MCLWFWFYDYDCGHVLTAAEIPLEDHKMLLQCARSRRTGTACTACRGTTPKPVRELRVDAPPGFYELHATTENWKQCATYCHRCRLPRIPPEFQAGRKPGARAGPETGREALPESGPAANPAAAATTAATTATATPPPGSEEPATLSQHSHDHQDRDTADAAAASPRAGSPPSTEQLEHPSTTSADAQGLPTLDSCMIEPEENGPGDSTEHPRELCRYASAFGRGGVPSAARRRSRYEEA